MWRPLCLAPMASLFVRSFMKYPLLTLETEVDIIERAVQLVKWAKKVGARMVAINYADLLWRQVLQSGNPQASLLLRLCIEAARVGGRCFARLSKGWAGHPISGLSMRQPAACALFLLTCALLMTLLRMQASCCQCAVECARPVHCRQDKCIARDGFEPV